MYLHIDFHVQAIGVCVCGGLRYHTQVSGGHRLLGGLMLPGRDMSSHFIHSLSSVFVPVPIELFGPSIGDILRKSNAMRCTLTESGLDFPKVQRDTVFYRFVENRLQGMIGCLGPFQR